MQARSVIASLPLTLVPLFAVSLAHAQAPGDVIVAPVVVVPAPPAAPPVAAPCGCGFAARRESVMANRWAVGLSIGSMSLAPESDRDASTDFGIGELAVRFRATPRLELELSAASGRDQHGDEVGDLEVNTVALAARLRFNPEGRWNWFLMGGIGGAAVARHDATEREIEDATHPLAMLGIGVERRFRHLALQLEARAVAIGDEDDDRVDVMADAPPAAEAFATSVSTQRERLGGGSVTFGVSYYF